jgi:hypothetical protein
MKGSTVTSPPTPVIWPPPGWLEPALRVLTWHISQVEAPFETWAATHRAFLELAALAPVGTSPPVFEPDPAPLEAVRAILAAPPSSAGAVEIAAAARAVRALDQVPASS